MKKLLLYLVVLLISSIGIAQQDLLEDWTLHYMVIDGTTYNVAQPHPSNPMYDPGIEFFEDTSGFQVVGFIHFNAFTDQAPPVLIDNTTFTVNSPSVTLGDCMPYCELEGQYLSTILFGTGGPRTFDYQILNQPNGDKILIINTPEGNIAVHGNYILSTNSFEQAKIRLYPNPAENSLNIISANSVNFKEYRILSMTGKVVLEKRIASLQNINVASLNSGLYFLELTSEDDQRYVQKFIKK